MPGTMVMYGVGVTDDPLHPAQPVTPYVPLTPEQVLDMMRQPIPVLQITILRERAEAVMRWHQDVTLLRKPADRLKHSRPCKLWQALEASEWAREAGLPSVDDGELVSMWLHGRRERR